MDLQAANSGYKTDPGDLYPVLGQVANGETGVGTALAVARRISEHHGVSVMRTMIETIKGSQSIFDDSPQGQRFREVVEAIDGFLRPRKVARAQLRQFRIA